MLGNKEGGVRHCRVMGWTRRSFRGITSKQRPKLRGRAFEQGSGWRALQEEVKENETWSSNNKKVSVAGEE